MIGRTVSHYRIIKKLGAGGMGVVYLAEDTHLGRRVAIKFLPADSGGHNMRARFLREARAASALNHPHIAAVYDYGETPEGQPFIVMELVTGQTLAELLRADALTLTRTLEIIEQTAQALAEAHRRGVIHRDIKPSNVALSERGTVKVLDFGLAKLIAVEPLVEADQEARTLLATHTRSGAIIGTPLYLSPEQAMGTAVDARSDLFALGVVLYECLAGRPPFSGANLIEVAAQVLHVEPAPPSRFAEHIPPELDRIALKALAKKPAERYQSADELLGDLQAARAMLPDPAQARTQRLPSKPNTLRAFARTTLSGALQRPRPFAALLLVLALVSLALWGSARWSRLTPYQPSPEAMRWYEAGVNALRDGTYYKASKMLEQAVAADSEFALAHARLAEAWMELDYTDKAHNALLRVHALTHNRSVLPPQEALYLDAITATATRNFTGAINSYLEIARQAPDSEKPHAYFDIGRAYERNEEIDKAIQNYIEATSRSPEYAAALLRLGILYGRQQSHARATDAFDRAETIYEATSNYEGVTQVFYERGRMFSKSGRVTEARPQFQRALEIARTTANLYQRITILLNLSHVSVREGNTTQAQEYATEAINLARANGLENLTTQGLIDLGNAYFVRGEIAHAEENFQQALEYARRYQGRLNEARALLSLGSLRIQQHEADAGLRYVEQALPFFQHGGYSKETSQAFSLLGQAHRLKGDYAAALRAYQQQLQLAEQIGDQSQVASSHHSIGVLLADQEQYPQALHHFRESHAIYDSLRNQLNAGYSLLNYSDMLWRLGQYAESRVALNQVLSFANRPGRQNRPLLVRVHLIKAQAALSDRRFAVAEAEGRRVVETDESRVKHRTIEAKHTLGLAQAMAGARQAGLLTCQEAVEMARGADDPRLLSGALLALAEAKLASGDAPGALSAALQAQESFARFGQQESEWRAWLIAGRASQRLGDQETARAHLSRANEALARLRQTWGEGFFGDYLTRPDVQFYRRLLGEASFATHPS